MASVYWPGDHAAPSREGEGAGWSHARFPVDPPARGPMTADGVLQQSVHRAVQDATSGDDRLRVTHTVATQGWGDVLYVDVFALSRNETLEDLDHGLRQIVAVAADRPYERVTIRWRLSH